MMAKTYEKCIDWHRIYHKYRRSSIKKRSLLLDELCDLTGMNRKYLIRKLNNSMNEYFLSPSPTDSNASFRLFFGHFLFNLKNHSKLHQLADLAIPTGVAKQIGTLGDGVEYLSIKNTMVLLWMDYFNLMPHWNALCDILPHVSAIVNLRLLKVIYALGKTIQEQDLALLLYLKKRCEMGDVESYCHLGDIYQQGNGVEKNIVTAATYYQQAIDNGCVQGEQKLNCLFKSDDITVNELYTISNQYRDGIAMKKR